MNAAANPRDLCIMACVFCRDPAFQRWVESLAGQGGVACSIDDEGAKAFILALCEVSTRNNLDKDQAAAARFHQLVREPFLAWKEQHG